MERSVVLTSVDRSSASACSATFVSDSLSGFDELLDRLLPLVDLSVALSRNFSLFLRSASAASASKRAVRSSGLRAQEEPDAACAEDETDEESDDHGAQDHRPASDGLPRGHKNAAPTNPKVHRNQHAQITRPSCRGQGRERKESRSLRISSAAATLSSASIAASRVASPAHPCRSTSASRFPCRGRASACPSSLTDGWPPSS